MASIRLALAGDVMIGRGVDQIMRQPGDQRLYEGWVRCAGRYVELAEARSGPLPREVDPSYVWGDTTARLEDAGVEVRIVNLETAVTDSGHPWPGKGIHYRVNPENADCLSAGKIDVVTIANNHVLDWSTSGLLDTIEALDRLGVGHTGAGRDRDVAWTPASVDAPSGVVVVLGVGTPSSGIAREWSAGPDRPGVALIERLSDVWVRRIAQALDVGERAGVMVVSIHWGDNWVRHMPSSHRRFARSLIDAGVDLVHGHSSHHPLGIEVYRGRLIVSGCGDLITDYEGIGGHDEFRPELGAWYVVEVDAGSGSLRGLEIIPTKVHRFRLTTPDPGEVEWLSHRLEQSSTSEIRVGMRDGYMSVEW